MISASAVKKKRKCLSIKQNFVLTRKLKEETNTITIRLMFVGIIAVPLVPAKQTCRESEKDSEDRQEVKI